MSAPMDPNAAPAYSVVSAAPEEAARLFATLTLAFAADPPTRWLLRDAELHIRSFARFAEALGGEAFARGTAWAADDGAGTALWLPPGAQPDEAALTAFVEEHVPAPERADAFGVFEEMARHHPAEPHWYLPLIGVDPARQGCGVGTVLLRPMLEQCDATGVLAYLESTNPKNRPLYERHGFVALGEIQVGRCPPIVPMLRRPRPAAPRS